MNRVARVVGVKLRLKNWGVAHMQKGKVLPGPENPSTEPDDDIKCLPNKDTYGYL